MSAAVPMVELVEDHEHRGEVRPVRVLQDDCPEIVMAWATPGMPPSAWSAEPWVSLLVDPVAAGDPVHLGHDRLASAPATPRRAAARRREIAFVLRRDEPGRDRGEPLYVRNSSPPYTTSTMTLSRSSHARPGVAAGSAVEARLNSLKNQPEASSAASVSGSVCSAFGLSQPHRAGLRVSELNAEKSVETAMVRANWRKNWPVMPVMKAHGTNTAHEHQRDGDDRPGHLVHRLDGRLARRQPVLDVMLDGLDHDDGVVHDDADGQHQPEQRQVVQAEAERRP